MFLKSISEFTATISILFTIFFFNRIKLSIFLIFSLFIKDISFSIQLITYKSSIKMTISILFTFQFSNTIQKFTTLPISVMVLFEPWKHKSLFCLITTIATISTSWKSTSKFIFLFSILTSDAFYIMKTLPTSTLQS